jgi:ribosomal protein S18 acetylase RimI-like enzyme
MAADQEELRIRPGRRADREFVALLSAEVFSRFGDYDRILPEWMDSPAVRTLVAEASGAPAGFVMVGLEESDPGVADLLAIAVAPAWQHRGVGRRLLAAAEELARSSAPDPSRALVVLTVAVDNARARSLFEAAGYAVLPGESGRYPGGQRALRMRRALGEGRPYIRSS